MRPPFNLLDKPNLSIILNCCYNSKNNLIKYASRSINDHEEAMYTHSGHYHRKRGFYGCRW